MFFSERFHVDSELIRGYGAVNISLVCDVPLFVDPMLIFNSEKEEYKQLHNSIIKYFYFLYKKASQGLNKKEVNAWFNFSEVPNNWLGYSLEGNKGLALGKKYAEFLYNNIAFAVSTSGVSESVHIEKVMLLYDGSGKDKISDLTVNLIKGFLCEYTQNFSLEYIDKEHLDTFAVDKAFFNYETESFVSKEYVLPFVIDEKGKKEFVLLTPYDILREEEPSINKKHFFDSYDRIRGAIDNDSLRTYVNNYLTIAVQRYEDNQKSNGKVIKEKSIARIEREAFEEVVKEHPEIYDYYIKMREGESELIRSECISERNELLEKLFTAAQILVDFFRDDDYQFVEGESAREEAKKRLQFFKHIIEDCDGYKSFYVNGKRIAKENDLQRLFKYVWYGTSYKVDAEPNNGRGQVDFLVSKGSSNQNIVEFKLASNSTLSHVFEQVRIYEVANCTSGSLIAIFYFTEEEYIKSLKIVKDAGYEKLLDESIYLIDCRCDNKASASVPSAS